MFLDRLTLLSTSGDANVTLQLAGVLLINAGFLELSRIDSGDKNVSREEDELTNTRREEFGEFARVRIEVTGGERSVHKSDVVRSFRRYYGKYRTEEVEGGVTDRDVEGMFAQWNKREGTGKLPTKAGFVKGLVVREDEIMK